MLSHNELNQWYTEFKSKLNTRTCNSQNLYIVNNDFFISHNKNENFNQKILNNNNEIEENKNFFIVNDDIWRKIQKYYPHEKEIKIDGRYDNKKYLFLINRYIYYFYFINNNDLIEGYFRFQTLKHSSEIINKFLFDDVNDFINGFSINLNNHSEVKINYNSYYFFFKIKPNNEPKNFNMNQINNNKFNNIENLNNNKNINHNNIIMNNINKNVIINFNNNNNHHQKNNNHNNNNFQILPKQNINMINMNINNNNKNNNKQNFLNNNNQNKKNNFIQLNPFLGNMNQQNLINNNFKPLFNNNINNNNNNKIKPRPHSSSKIIGNHKKPLIPKNSAAGLNNIGATCYMNATLQCLAHVKKLTRYFLKPERIQNIQKNNLKCKLTNSYLIVLINLWQNINIKNYSPHNFKQIISDMNPLFKGVQANDSKDLILFLLETMHNELNIPLSNSKPPSSNMLINQNDFNKSLKIFTKFFQNTYRSVISNLFYGFFDSVMLCKNCKITTHNIQCYNILIFPLEEVRIYKKRPQNIVSIEECFEHYQKQDTMSGSNQIYCNSCKRMSDSINYSKLITSPNILILNLNRGKGLQFNITIEFDEYLDIKKFLYFNQSNDIPSFYEIIGIVTHFGPSGMSGHFIAFCKSFVDNKWYKYNDSIVSPSSFQEARNTGVPYILFYSGIKR